MEERDLDFRNPFLHCLNSDMITHIIGLMEKSVYEMKTCSVEANTFANVSSFKNDK